MAVAPTSSNRGFRRVRPAPNLVDQVVEQVRGEVLGGALSPGDSLPAEGRLAEQFGVSRTVIREALHQLRSEGMVEVSHGRRPRVKPPSAEASVQSLVTWMQRSDLAIGQLLEVRRPIECEIARLAAGRLDPAAQDELRADIDALRAAATLGARIEHDAAFHRRLAEATGNPVFTMLLDAMAALLNEQRRLTLRGPGAVRAADDHQRILDAIVAGDAAAATAAMRMHLVWPRGDAADH